MYPSSGDESWRGVFVKEQVDALVDLFPNVHIDILHIKGSVSNGGSNINYFAGLWRYLVMRFKKNYDFVWAHHSFCVFLTLTNRKIPLIYTVHEGSLTKGVKFALIKKAISISDRVIYVNKVFFDSSHHPKKYFLPSGVDTNKYRPQLRSDCCVQLGLDTAIYYIFFPASPHRPEKNSAFAYSFIEKYSSWLKHENIQFIFGGDIDYELMPIWMNAVDCLVSFSNFESDGMVFKEAMACNLPVITFNVGNAQIYLKDEIAGSIIEQDHDSLRDKIAYWKKVGRSQGRDYLLTFGMDRNSVAQTLVSIFAEIYDGKN